MRIESFEWDGRNVEHIARHSVEPDEVEEIFLSRYYLAKTRTGRYITLGRSAAGRHLFCVIEKTARPGIIRVIMVRDMTDSEKKLFKRKVT